MAEQIRFRKEDLLRAEYRGRREYSKLHLVARKGEPVRTYEDRKNWLGNVKEVCIISETETYQEDMYVTDWTNSRWERKKYEHMNPISAWINDDMICFIEDNIIYMNYPHLKEGVSSFNEAACLKDSLNVEVASPEA